MAMLRRKRQWVPSTNICAVLLKRKNFMCSRALEAREQLREQMSVGPDLWSTLFTPTGHVPGPAPRSSTQRAEQQAGSDVPGSLIPKQQARKSLRSSREAAFSHSGELSPEEGWGQPVGSLSPSCFPPAQRGAAYCRAGPRGPARLPEASAPPEVLQGPLDPPHIHGHHVRRGAGARLQEQPKEQSHGSATSGGQPSVSGARNRRTANATQGARPRGKGVGGSRLPGLPPGLGWARWALFGKRSSGNEGSNASVWKRRVIFVSLSWRRQWQGVLALESQHGVQMELLHFSWVPHEGSISSCCYVLVLCADKPVGNSRIM